MASRGSALTRALRYFKEADLEEAEVAFELVKRTLAGRQAESRKQAPTPTRKPRKPRGSLGRTSSAEVASTEGETLANA